MTLLQAKGKIGRAEKALQKVLVNQEPENLPTDLETLTDEERFTLRRIGLSMKPYLLLGNNSCTRCFCLMLMSISNCSLAHREAGNI